MTSGKVIQRKRIAMTACNECGVELTPITNSSKPGGCCIECEDSELNWKHVNFGFEDELTEEDIE